MRVLIACEESQTVCKEFRALGHEAYSCDIVPCSGEYPEWHLEMPVQKVLHKSWDMILAFPMCTDLAVSGAKWFDYKRSEGMQANSVAFFMMFTANWSPKWAIENPIGVMSTLYRKPDQIIQPWQFGHGETKSTCLWLNGLPKLKPTEVVEGREQRIWKMPPSKDRAKLRSKTYEGIAKAMANQWS